MKFLQKFREINENLCFDVKISLLFSGLRSANENMDKLMTRLEKLSNSIGQLNPASASPAHANNFGNGGPKMDFGHPNNDRVDR